MTIREASASIITLTTDFGTHDAYVGAMKGVMLNINKYLKVIDITHDLPRFQITPAALVLKAATPYYPEKSIHLGVIDPGVGGQRRPVLIKIQNRFYIGPDNGIFGLLLNESGFEGAWELSNNEYFLDSVSRTFHGRDIFAPVAAYLAKGVNPEDLGPEITDPETLDLPPYETEKERLQGEILWIDHFGNCVTNLDETLVAGWAQGVPFNIQAAAEIIFEIVLSYEAVARGKGLAIYNSMGYLEIACNQARADSTLGLVCGDPVVLQKTSK